MLSPKELHSQLSDEHKAELENVSAEVKQYIALSSIFNARQYSTMFTDYESQDIQQLIEKLVNYKERLIAKEEEILEEEIKKEEGAKQAYSKIEEMLKAQGLDLTVDEFIAQAQNSAPVKVKVKKASKPVKPQFRLHDGQGEIIVEWSGRGLKPKAIKQFLENGGDLEEIRI